MNNFTKFLGVALIAAISFTACDKDDPNDTNNGKIKYAIWTQVGSWPNTNYYIMSADDLTKGSAKLEGSGIDVTTTLNNSVIVKDGYYYFYNSAEGKFGKYQVENGAVNTIKQVPMTNLKSLTGHTWIDDHTLVIIGLNATSTGVNYSIINTNAMTFTNSSVTGLPAFEDDFEAYQVGGDIQYKDGKLYFSVCLHNTTEFVVFPRLYTMAVSYPGFNVTATSTDDRVAGVGNTSGYFATSFVDKNGDMYFLTSWNINWTGVGERSPKNILRIKKGEDELDDSYYLDVLEETGHEAAAGLFMDLGNGRAILKYQEEQGNLNNEFGYSIIDLATGKEYRKLDEIPVNFGGERNVLVENGKAYIAVKTAGDKDYIYIYDSATDKVTKGMELAGGYVSFSRIDRLN